MPPRPLSLIKAIIMGPPGSGKGTVSSRIVKKFSLNHISSGDILRHHISGNTELGLEAKKFTSSGLLVPDNLVTKVVLAELKSIGEKSWLLDGYPRTVSQAEELDRNYNVDMVLNLDVPFETITDRISKRWIHPGSGRTYNLDFNAPNIEGKDDITGEDLVQREDDKPESVQNRLELYSNMTKPLLDYYSDQDKVISFSGTETNVIWPLVQKYLEEKTEASIN
ncbi:GTP:AMP phosphotransferase AK3, mitochondrial-like [Bolinopsis microptera]|uniref:GTP:AMP phosphotransferase AK3, mitochondrial-like n=1 Tax=Bolinopsis microptera TaxID=2820187 RepID=UPI003079C946